ncbi:MAG: GHKL domain-containing protein [Provencibacterium sp.]|jgi:hypothetical protein|nr:GHKL domain-containing protein [Provencibacterium sp.]
MGEVALPLSVRLLDGAAGFSYAACLALFFRPFVRGRGKRWKKAAPVFFSYLFCWFCCGSLLPQAFSIPLMALFILPAGDMAGIERTSALLLLLFYFCTKICAGLTVGSLYSVLDSCFPLEAVPPEMAGLRSGVAVALLLLVHLLLLGALLNLLKRQLLKRWFVPDRRELCYLGILPLAGILFGRMVAGLLFEEKDGVLLLLYERHPGFLLLVPLLAALFYLGMLFATAFEQGMLRLREEREAAFVQRQQAQAIRGRLEEWERTNTDIRQLRHDLRGHLNNLRGLAQGGHYQEIDAYIARMDAQLSGYEPGIQTGNAVTDVVINDKRQQAAQLQIDFKADFCYPSSKGYDAFDIGVILHNLLQNALEACEGVEAGQRYIVLTGRQKGAFFLLEVKNPFAREAALEEDGLPATIKRGEEPHGLGLPGVRRTAEKYAGEMEITMQGQEFCITLLLQEKE